MQKYEAIETGIKNNDVKALREAIGSICYTSSDFSSGEFDEAIEYVESKGIQLKDDALIGDPTISSQKQDFSDEDFARAIYELKENFCDERIQDVKTIGKALYRTNLPEKTDAPAQDTGTLPNGQGHQPNNNTLPVIAGLVAVVLVVLLVILLLWK